MNQCALVIGGNHQNTLGVIEALGQKGVLSTVIIIPCSEKSFVLKSKYVKEGYTCEDDVQVLSRINEVCKNKTQSVIAIACCDDAASFLDDNYKVLPSNLIYPSTINKGELSSWTHKYRMTSVASSLGISVPRSWLINNKEIPDDIIYPCVTKPITSVHNGKEGFSKCNTKEELEDFLKNYPSDEQIQVQQYIDKRFEFQLIGCSLDSGNVIIIPGRTHIETASNFNNLTFLKYTPIEDSLFDTLEKAKAFVRETKYSGLFSVEFIKGSDNKDYFLEMNFRNDGNGIVVTSAGVNLPYIWYSYNAGNNILPEASCTIREETYMFPELSRFYSWMGGYISFKQWRKEFKLANCYLSYFKDDKKPFYELISTQRKTIIRSICGFILRVIGLKKVLKSIFR